MQIHAFHALSTEWQEWTKTNLHRGCAPIDMVNAMVRDGRFDQGQAMAAINEVILEEKPVIKLRHDLDTTSNVLQTPDRFVHVLFAMTSPRIVLLGSVLSDEECDELCSYVLPRLTRSTVVDAESGVSTPHSERTSMGTMMTRGETELALRVESRLAALIRWPIESSEGLQVQWYGVGNEYRAHYDWFDPCRPGTSKHLEHGGQRLGTFILYLNDVPEGRGTGFPKLGLQVQPRKGNAIFFGNLNANGVPDLDTRHAGLPVISGQKIIANKWLRERPY